MRISAQLRPAEHAAILAGASAAHGLHRLGVLRQSRGAATTLVLASRYPDARRAILLAIAMRTAALEGVHACRLAYGKSVVL